MKTMGLFSKELHNLIKSNTFKSENPLQSPQDGKVKVNGKTVIMLASNNYLGFSNHPVIKNAAIEGIRKYGYGMASVRFLCGTMDIHLELEKNLSKFVGAEDTILFSSCFTANGGFFASLTNERLGVDDHKDIIYSDQLNHASIIDGQRLCRSEYTNKKIYHHVNMEHLEQLLREDKNIDYRFRIISTDGVFSMDGDVAPLDKIVSLSRKYHAILFVDDSHGIGVCGKTGRGSPEIKGVLGKIDVLSGTLGKALGGAEGGYLSGNKDLIAYLRQKARPYTFSNSIPPSTVVSALAAIDLLAKDKSIIKNLYANTRYFRREISKLGFTILKGDHPIVPIMLGEAALAQEMSEALLKQGVYIKGLWYPVVPKGEARLRAQISAAHTKEDLDRALDAFHKTGKKIKII
ncbi:MAG: glycine C-acetyltransferase [Bacteroidota bacterium]